MAKHEAPSATQMEFPSRAAIRAGGAAVVGGLLAASAASVVAGPALDHVLPGHGLGAWVIAAGGSCGVIAAAANRIANLKPVAAWLTQIGLGPVPKAVAAAQRSPQP